MYLTVREVAMRLRISASSVYALVEGGKLAHHRIGTGRGAIRVSEEDLAEYLADCRRAPAGKQSPPPPAARLKLKHIKL